MKSRLLRNILIAGIPAVSTLTCLNAYDNFKVAIYCPVLDVEGMLDRAYLETAMDALERHLTIDKVYLETHRRNHMVDKADLKKVITYFESRDIETAGGITTTGERAVTGRFGLFCYTSDEDLQQLEKIVRFTARHFDEVILDDFYFTDCRCKSCIAAKGELSWPEFRTRLMAEVSRSVVMKSAREENPDVRVIIKYPNWYDYYQYTGYNLKDQPAIFDAVYTGTETRDPVFHQQHLQPYQGYLLMRYLENIAPGRNDGGWVDPLDMRTLNRYGEQLSLTLFAHARELTLFRFGSLLDWVMQQDTNTLKPLAINAAVAGQVFDKVDSFIGALGDPIGLPAYKPLNSSGEPFLPAYMGMLGMPLDLVAEFPFEANTVLLTEASAFDPELVDKMKRHLCSGNRIVMTSGLLRKLKGKGIEDITTASYTDGKFKAHAYSDLRFSGIHKAGHEAAFPIIGFPTNDAWMEITAISGDNSFPLVTQAEYGGGLLRILTIPDDFADLYHLPMVTLTQVKRLILQDLPIRLEGPAKVSLFLYDNNTCIVHSFLPHKAPVRLILTEADSEFVDLLRGRDLSVYQQANETVLELELAPYDYWVLSWK